MTRLHKFPRPRLNGTANGSNGHLNNGQPVKVLAKRVSDPRAAELPPHDTKAERAVLGCVIHAGSNLGSQAEADHLLSQLRPSYFYNLDLRNLHACLADLRSGEEPHAIDTIMINRWIRENSKQQELPGLDVISVLEDEISPARFLSYLRIVKQMAHRRALLSNGTEMAALAYAEEVNLDQTKARLAEIFEESQVSDTQERLINMITPAEARAFVPDPADFLVGKGLISRGEFVVIGGEPGCGKSRLATTLAVAGARGNGTWQAYPVTTKWRSYILQTENTGNRLKEEYEAIPKDYDDQIKVSNNLPKGLAFGSEEFRRELRREFEQWPFQMLQIDPWNDVSSEEGQAEFKEAFSNIRRCFYGKTMPCVVILAHFRKQGRDTNGTRRKTGRQLMHEFSGSLALGSTARTMFCVQPATETMGETRIVFEVAKANNVDPAWLEQHGTRSAWHRKNGAFERCKEFDWDAWMNPSTEQERRAVTLEMLQAVFGETKRNGMKGGELVKALKSRFEVGSSTAWRAIGAAGYAREWLNEAANVFSLKEEFKP